MTDRCLPLYRAMLVATSAIVTLTCVANADSRGAPIVYGDAAGRVQTAPAAPSSPVISPRPTSTVTATVADPRAARLEFRYPGSAAADVSSKVLSTPSAFQPTAAYGAQAAVAAPLTASKYAALPNTGLSFKVAPETMSLSESVASKAVEAAPMEPIRIAAQIPDAAKPVGRPLTLSSVRATTEAKITEESGKAGVYTEGFDGRPTANGEIFDKGAMTAAHPTLPLPSLVQVSNQSNGREIVVRVNDRGPFAGDRILDLSERAAEVLGFSTGQTAPITLRYLGPAPVMQVEALGKATQYASVSEPVLPAKPFGAAPVQAATYATPSPAVAAPLAPTLAASPAKVGQGNVFIQAGAFTDIGNARSLTNALGRQMPVEIQEARVNQADYFRVMIGPFNSKTEANIHRSQLRAAGIADGFLVEK